MTATQIEERPAHPTTEFDSKEGPTFFQECVKANVAQSMPDLIARCEKQTWIETAIRAEIKQTVSLAMNAATVTCKQLATNRGATDDTQVVLRHCLYEINNLQEKLAKGEPEGHEGNRRRLVLKEKLKQLAERGRE